jgi:eukaryotic-like serine/threonine-protein kinase
MGFHLGRTYSGYEFLELLRSSEIEVAYKVRNHLSQRLEELKVLSADWSDEREGVERFLREMKVHARLLHPNIVTFYTAAELEGHLVMTTELVEGITLAERFRQMGGLDWREAVSHITQVLMALGCAHEQGIIHRNVTPESVILTADTTVKLGGFGLAKPLASPSLTQAGAVLGTLKYIPPEQIRGLGTLDARGDLYSVGVVLYEALTGRLPFDSRSQFQVMMDHVRATPPAPSAVNPQVPPEFDSVALMALAKDPAERFQTAEQFRAQLEIIKDTLRAKGSSASGMARRAREERSWPDTHAGDLSSTPGAASLVPSFCAETQASVGNRNLLILGVSSLLAATAAAVFFTMVRL